MLRIRTVLAALFCAAAPVLGNTYTVTSTADAGAGTRRQAILDANGNPGADSSADFLDVPCPSPFADWIEQLAAESITGGCGGGNYCPAQSVRRDQMAAFLFNTFQF